METTRARLVTRPPPTPAPAARAPVIQASLQTSLRVSSPSDPAEKEAESTAKKVMRMQSPYVARFAGTGVPLHRQRDGNAAARPDVGANVAAEIQGSLSAGAPLPLTVRRFMEPRFGADFGGVRVHTGDRAASLNAKLSARAFAVGNHLFFGRDQFRPEGRDGQELIAHELTHTIQQGSVTQRGVRRSEDVTVRQMAPAGVQRLGVGDALDHFANAANAIPGFRMLTIVLGVNPINMSGVDRSAANVLRAVVEFMPGGALITRALDNYGIFDRIGGWVEGQVRSLGMTGAALRDAVMRFLESLGWRDIFDLGGVWSRARRIFSEPADRLISFARGLVTGILGFIRDAVLRPIAGLAQQTRGYDLLKAVLGQDPITGDPYPRNADTLIGGFMKLIGQDEVWENVKRASAVARAWAWFQGALGGLLGFARGIPGQFLATLRSLGVEDLVLLPRAFAKVAGTFLGVAGQFVSWAGGQVMSLLQIIFEVVAPGAMVYIRRAAGAFQTIVRNPVGFVGNLVRAGLLGFRQFAANFLGHLRASLVQWLTGTLSGAGVYVPQAFTLREIIKFVLSVLGLTWQNIRQKIVRVVGEPAVRALETGFDVVMTLVTQGPAAAWEKIQESLTNLREMVIEQVMTFVRDRVVQAAITRLVTSLNPAGAFVQAVIAIYNTIMFFVERLRQISQVAMSFIDSIAAIASGAIGAAANRVETTMAGLLTLVISFLARIAGLGRVSDAVVGIINRVRAPIDRALDRVVAWIVTQARRLGRLAASGARSILLRFTRPKSFSAGRESHQTWVSEAGEPQVASNAMPLGTRVGTWRRRVSSLSAAEQAMATPQINAVAQLNDELRQAARDALRARERADAAAVDAAQATIDLKQAALQPPLANLFVLFGDTQTATGAADEARLFALMEVYDQVVVPLKRRGLVAGTPGTVSQTFRSQWNRRQVAQARGWAVQMERVLAAARNVGTGRLPYLTGVEVRIPGSEVDYTVRDQDVERQVQVDVAIEVKNWGAMRERTARSGRTITIPEQIQQRINTLTNQVQSALASPAYSVVIVEVRGLGRVPPDLHTAFMDAVTVFQGLATTLNKRFAWRQV